MAKLARRIFAAVLGATTGLSVVRYDSVGAEVVLNEPIPWVRDKDLWIWPLNWLCEQLERLKWNLAEASDIIVSGMWGADLALVRKSGGKTLPLLHYRSATNEDLDNMLFRISRTREEMYLLSGGAAAACYQPLGLLAATEKHQPEIFDDDRIWGIVPMSGIMSWRLSNEPGQDPIMRQSMGLHAPTAAKLYQGLQIGGVTGDSVGAGAVLGIDTIFETRVPNGTIRVIPTSHDSVFSRLVGLAECCSVIWTGSWLGTTIAVDEKIQPTPNTFRSSINFEGLGPYRAAVTNTAMFGPDYKELVRRLGVKNYTEASALAMTRMTVQPMLASDVANHRNVVEIACKMFPDPAMVLASYIIGVANTIAQELKGVSKTLGLDTPRTVAITGGWAENAAFIQALQMNELDVIIPRHASSATHAGLAADGLVRCGEANDIKGALDMLPEL